MTLTKLLKTGRERAGLTQEAAGEALGVHAKTIHNWEDGCVRPDPSLWSKIMDVYGIVREEFRDAYFDAACPPKNLPLSESFPIVLFTDYTLDTVRKMVFSPMETELLKMLSIYYPDWLHYNNEVDVYRKLPPNYICRFDIAEFRTIINSLQNRFGRNTDLFQTIADWITCESRLQWKGLAHGPVEEFNINELPLLYIVDMAASFRDWNSLTYQAFLMIKLIKSGHTTVFRNDTKIYKFISKARPLDVNLDSYFYSDWGKLIQIHEMYTDSRDSNTSSEEISGTRVIVPSSFSWHTLLLDSEAIAPASDWIRFDYTHAEDCLVACIASLTEKGEALWEYATTHPDLFDL